MTIEIKNLTKIYGEQKALDNVSLSIGEGEIVGLLGPNGAGKSTMMKIITCFIPPTQGEVKVCGYDIFNEPMKVRSSIGYLPEQNPLYLEMYVREFLTFVAGIHNIDNKVKKERVDMMIEKVGLTKEVNKKIGMLSKGYRQRVGIAQAMIHNPKVLILDEPTTGLDPNQLVEIRELVKQLGQEKTVLLSTHIMQEVEAVCKRVIIINNGRLVADDSIEHLAKGQSLETIFRKITIE
ncbi:MAG: ATP-binding cassette domain-containing protein [Bacteroidales bacterium]|jgi:ABC-2 type transport system ATP-binding protein|nr:ATP-binding cassette domain-containing protein [Bacteroidales bacterium]